MRISLFVWGIFFVLLALPALADVATLSFSEKTLLQGTPQTVTVKVDKLLFEMTDVELQLTIQGPAYFEPKSKTATIRHDKITNEQTDSITLYLDDKFDGVTGDVNISYKLTYDTRTGPHIEKGQGSFQGVWSEQGDCVAKLNLCRAALNSKENEFDLQNQGDPPNPGISTIAVLILCILCLVLGGFLGYKITHHFYPPKQQG
ncbi:MAG TPA: hypothetical protein VJG90_02600 [Candidatus Nanoarchaeia archaeon]|nr:hypothetical protein [Candidatus Nanoarchaeia archaeon]